MAAKKIGISLDDERIAAANRLGEGNVSAGIRAAIDRAENPAIIRASLDAIRQAKEALKRQIADLEAAERELTGSLGKAEAVAAAPTMSREAIIEKARGRYLSNALHFAGKEWYMTRSWLEGPAVAADVVAAFGSLEDGIEAIRAALGVRG